MDYYGQDPAPEGPAYTIYTGQLGASRQYHQWTPVPSHHSGGSSQDFKERHKRSRSRDSQPGRSVDRPGPLHRHQDPPRHSVSGIEGQLAHLNLLMDTISEEQANISQALAEHQQWNGQFIETLNNIQQNQQHTTEPDYRWIELGSLLRHSSVLSIEVASSVTLLGKSSQGFFINNLFNTSNNKLGGGAPKFFLLPNLR
ncbi:hypothetical protein BDA96_10G156900 [Sorghum bicolor]|uniref:Uncharacterized protein n=2 Tax=Sorghum bicolor TaxID=4558 RepID=A0A921Q3F4_SORBI|nr:hypothetical protein BDA96_10G156900 [Sorghum bicolor]KXG19847.1 hypothetical protein SORBI_3010G125900 [Sorghum bicolor]